MSLRLLGRPAAPGLCVGPIWRPAGRVAEPAAWTARSLDDAAALAADELAALAGRLRGLDRVDEAGILDAQALMARDETLLATAREAVTAGIPPPTAVRDAAEAIAVGLDALDDEVLAARAADVRDVGARLARILAGRELELPTGPSVALTDDLPPSVAAEIPPGHLLGIGLAGGSPTSHAVILARALGIPAVVGLRGLEEALASGALDGHDVALDGTNGMLIGDPSETELAQIRARIGAGRAAEGTPAADDEAATSDGVRITILANITRPPDSARAMVAGAQGVGLFRTEFLYLGRDRPPTEDEQVEAYAAVFDVFGPERPVVVRLADIGGDKPIPYLDLPAEGNPFLGVRALRLVGTARVGRDLYLTQLRAILRAAAVAGVAPHVLVPMVATTADVRLVRELLGEARAGLDAGASAGAAGPRVGIMVEVPSVVVRIDHFLPMVDFLSIGTNDLSQYLMAADRTNADLERYHDPLEPSVLAAVDSVAASAARADIPVAVCGEMAGDPLCAQVLVGLGVRELSMDAGSMAGVRASLRARSSSDLRALARAALEQEDATGVRHLVGRNG